MRSRFVVIAKITFQYPPQMFLAEHNHVIQALATYASNHPLGVWILPWALCSSPHFLNANSLNSFLKVFTIDAVTISEKITCRFILRKRFNYLLRGPSRRRMFGDIKVNHPASFMHNTMNTNNTCNLAVGTVKKPTETRSRRWLSKKVRHVWDGAVCRWGISRDTVRSEISIPSLSSSP